MATASYPTPHEDSLSKHLQCSLCLQDYHDARILPCFHTFCARCLETSCLQQTDAGKPSLYCPVCMDESDLPQKGVQGLPKNMYVQNLQDLQSIPAAPPKCDLCTDNELAVGRCEVCSCYLCEFCNQAHLRQRKTADHPIIPLEIIASAAALPDSLPRPPPSTTHYPSNQQPQFCEVHSGKELRLFCESCEMPVCQECSMEEHQNHAILPLEDVNMQYSEIIQNLLTQTKPLVSALKESTKSIEFQLSSIQERASVIAEDICDSVDARMRTLQEHKCSLLNQLEAIKQHKENTLDLQLENLKKVQEEVEVNCSLASKALKDGNAATVFGVKVPIVARLQELIGAKHDFHPQEDDYIHFYPSVPAGQCRGFDVFGVLDSTGPSAAHSVVEGDGLFEARQRKMAVFLVCVYDRYGQRRLSGEDKVEARVHSRNGTAVNTAVNNNGDGTYQVTYTPESAGEHRLSVLIEGKHVRASPFVVNVRPKRKKHRGTFHCCTFCSSEGKKHVRCGCGGMMPGGYSGCGHGHPGHPGCWHWSCCGSTVEKSECLL